LGSGQLSQAALAFEAAVQKSPSHAEAWFHLGTTQAENEKEGPAILALEKSVREDPLNAAAFMVIQFFYSLGSCS
jgi:peroxin-5